MKTFFTLALALAMGTSVAFGVSGCNKPAAAPKADAAKTEAPAADGKMEAAPAKTEAAPAAEAPKKEEAAK